VVNRVGVLALQGNYNQHKSMLDELGIENILVKYPVDLNKCDLLIIPGGESTAISKQIERKKFRQPIINFAKTNSVFGTCAGMILLSSSEEENNLKPLSIMDFEVDRNAFGRQLYSFSGKLCLEFDDLDSFEGLFIRAPKISQIGKGIKILATYNKQPVMITNGKHFATTFHPEIGNDYRIHKYIMDKISE